MALGFAKASDFQRGMGSDDSYAAQHDPDNPFIESDAPAIGFSTARALAERNGTASEAPRRSRSLSPASDELPQKGFSDWFSTTTVPYDTPDVISDAGFQNPLAAFKSAGGRAVAVSAAALEAAQARMRAWNEENADSTPEPTPDVLVHPIAGPSTGFSQASATFASPRQVLASVHNAPGRSKEAEHSASGFETPAPKLVTPTFKPPVMTDLKGKAVVKPFHSPLLTRKAAAPTSSVSSPLNPRRAGVAAGFTTPARPFRPPSALVTSSAVESPVFRTPVRPSAFAPALGSTARRGGGLQKKFVTPFKQGMGPGELGRTQLQVYSRDRTPAPGTPPLAKKRRPKFFDLSGSLSAGASVMISDVFKAPLPGRKTLKSFGVLPGTYSMEDLKDMGM
jgi:breast cancer 2 susceptibility protein